jgi:aconitate hydratase
MVASGLVAKKALEKGLDVKPWVKTSLAPGSKVVTEYLEKSGLQDSLDALGFNLVGYGCTTCIGNSGPLPENIVEAINGGDLNVASVLSGNRNFEGRISPHVKSNYLASPPLVVAYALAGTMKADITKQSLGTDQDGNDVYLKDIWPTTKEIQDTIHEFLTPKMFNEQYADVFTGTDEWREISTTDDSRYQWEDTSTYVKKPPFFDGMTMDIPEPQDLKNARPLGIFGDTITTDHISPAGAIKVDSPAGKYLIDNGVEPRDFNSYGSRRGNHEVMMRGTFANIRIKNLMVPGVEGGYTKYMPDGEQMPIYDAAMKYIDDGTDLVVIAGKEYGTGSSRDWAAKGTILLGVKVVIAESYERIHRSNLIGMGVMPAQFGDGITRESLKLDGTETFDVTGLSNGLTPGKALNLTIHRADGTKDDIPLVARIDTEDELDYYRHGGILHYVLRQKAVN